MGLAESALAIRAPERRAISEWGTSAIPGPLGEPVSYGSYSSIDLRRAENSLQKVACWSACDLIASVASQLPLETYQKQPDGTSRQVDSPAVILDPGGEGYGVGDWIYQYLMSKLLRGNVYGKLVSLDQRGYPAQIVLYHPDEVQGWRDKQTGEVVWRIGGQLQDNPKSVWHRRSYPLPGQLLGMSPVAKHMTTVSQGLAAARFGLQWFTDGAHPSSLLQNSETEIDQGQAAEVKARYLAAIHGTREPVVMGKGWDLKQISVTAEESQFLETQKYTAAECCRIYGPCLAEVLGYETGGSMTYTNVEQRSIDLLKFTLNRWLRDLEEALSGLLPRPRYVRLKRKVLLETDLLSRYQAHRTARDIGLSNIDELRAEEDLSPLPGGQGKDYTPLLIQVAASRGIDAAQVKSGEAPTDQPARAQVWDGEVVEPPALPARLGDLDEEFRSAYEVLARAVGHDTTPGHDELHHYWTVGEGRAKWVGSPKPWTTLVALLTPHVGPEKAKVYASRWFIEVFGFAAGSDLNRVTHGHPPRGHRIGPG